MIPLRKRWLQHIFTREPWNTAVTQQAGHRGSLDILKMCFKIPKQVCWYIIQCPCRVGVACGQWAMSGTAWTHGNTLFRRLSQTTRSWSLSHYLTQRWRCLEASGHCGLKDSQTPQELASQLDKDKGFC